MVKILIYYIIFPYSPLIKMVLAYLNVFKLPENYQRLIWDGKIGIGHIDNLTSYFNGGHSPLKWLYHVLKKLSAQSSP